MTAALASGSSRCSAAMLAVVIGWSSPRATSADADRLDGPEAASPT
jgi:hypothetical protein